MGLSSLDRRREPPFATGSSYASDNPSRYSSARDPSRSSAARTSVPGGTRSYNSAPGTASSMPRPSPYARNSTAATSPDGKPRRLNHTVGSLPSSSRFGGNGGESGIGSGSGSGSGSSRALSSTSSSLPQRGSSRSGSTVRKHDELRAPYATSGLSSTLPTTSHSSSLSSSLSSSSSAKYGGVTDIDKAGSAATRAVSRTGSRRRAARGICGLHNIGNTCFLASAVQCMSNCAPLRGYLVDGDRVAADMRAALAADPAARRRGGGVAEALSDLVRSMCEASAQAAVTPSAFKREVSRIAPQFSGYQQQDSQELLRCTLDALHEGLNVHGGRKAEPLDEKWFDALPIADQAEEAWRRYLARNQSAATDIFAGQLCSQVVCDTCGFVSPCFDPFLDISVPIPARRAAAVSLVECFEEFSIEEELGDLYTCARCKTKRRAHKSLRIERLPPVLVVHLKRFQQQRFRRTKISTEVTFPLRGLDLGRFTTNRGHRGTEGATYSLFAVSCHSGSLGGGHYTAKCRNPENGKWYSFDDARVSEIPESSVAGPSAYMLCFERD